MRLKRALNNFKSAVSKVVGHNREFNIGHVYKLAAMTRSLEEIMPKEGNLGEKYDEEGVNIWRNDAARKAMHLLRGKQAQFRADFDANHSNLKNIDAQFST
mmetsp:Transcript_34105/g.52388  ORF Transcript_34105/g.52388 Transcript_34105/m.52388 type:complete len:101 (-) Transcript_34105:119-421(-)